MMSLPKKIEQLLLSRGESLSTAESCTGGGVASRVVSIDGSSRWFNGGVVAYSNASKCRILGVSPDSIERYGAVSEEVALQMAQGARELFDTTYAVATTGIAGPTGGSEEKPVGTVWFAVSTPHRSVAWQRNCGADRVEVTTNACDEALRGVIEEIKR